MWLNVTWATTHCVVIWNASRAMFERLLRGDAYFDNHGARTVGQDVLNAVMGDFTSR
jgi:hypothetical protein